MKAPSRPCSAGGEEEPSSVSPRQPGKFLESRNLGTLSAPNTRPASSEGFSRKRLGQPRQFPASAPGSRPNTRGGAGAGNERGLLQAAGGLAGSMGTGGPLVGALEPLCPPNLAGEDCELSGPPLAPSQHRQQSPRTHALPGSPVGPDRYVLIGPPETLTNEEVVRRLNKQLETSRQQSFQEYLKHHSMFGVKKEYFDEQFLFKHEEAYIRTVEGLVAQSRHDKAEHKEHDKRGLGDEEQQRKSCRPHGGLPSDKKEFRQQRAFVQLYAGGQSALGRELGQLSAAK